MKSEIVISHAHFPLIERQLLDRKIDFELVENTTGNSAEPSITIKVANERVKDVDEIIQTSCTKFSKRKNSKLANVSFWTLNILGSLVIVFFANFAIYEWNGGPEIWISFCIVLILVTGMWLIMFQRNK